MKELIITLFIATICIHSLHGQSNGRLNLEENKLSGTCDNRFFTGFEIELDSIYSNIDSLILFSQLPRMGFINFKNLRKIPTEFIITKRAGYPQIMFRFKSSYYTFDELEFESKAIKFSINLDPDIPKTEDDLKIIRLAKKILSEEKYWNKNDDRSCEDDIANKSYSLYCALKISSIEIEKRYNHRNAVLQALRHLIEEKYPNKSWNHRLMDYNNLEETSYQVIIDLLNEMEMNFIQEIKQNRK